MSRTARAAPMLALLVLVACGAAQDPSRDFERVEIEVGADPHVLAAELTGDGRPDLAVAGEGRVLILAGDGKGGSAARASTRPARIRRGSRPRTWTATGTRTWRRPTTRPST